VLGGLLQDLRVGHFRPRAIRRFIRDGIRHGIGLAWSLRDLRRSFYAASIFMACVLGLVGAILHGALPDGVGLGTWVGVAILFVIVFFLTLFQLGLVRTEQSGELYDRFVFPNVLTLLRLMVVPYLSLAIAQGREGIPAWSLLGLVMFSVLSDMMDGFLARTMKQTSDFGRIYDPVVDIIFHSSVAWALFRAGDVSLVFLVVVLVRYVLPPLAGSFLYLFREPFQVKSTIMGKLSSLVLSVFLCVVAAGRATGFAIITGPVSTGLEWLSIAICVATVVFFLGRGLKMLQEMAPKPPHGN
jgi:cardiolipin synthase